MRLSQANECSTVASQVPSTKAYVDGAKEGLLESWQVRDSKST